MKLIKKFDNLKYLFKIFKINEKFITLSKLIENFILFFTISSCYSIY